MFEEVWDSVMQHNTLVGDVAIDLFVPYKDSKRMLYSVRVYREQESRRIRLLGVMYPNGIPVSRLPRGAKRELRRVFPLAVLML